jgi:hypothetical protein
VSSVCGRVLYDSGKECSLTPVRSPVPNSVSRMSAAPFTAYLDTNWHLRFRKFESSWLELLHVRMTVQEALAHLFNWMTPDARLRPRPRGTTIIGGAYPQE